MRQYRVSPPKEKLESYLRRGLTQAQIVSAWEEESGHRVARSTIAMAIERYGLESAHPRPRYDDFLPWKVSTEHRNSPHAECLRLAAREDRGDELTLRERRRLENWRDHLRENDAIVHYSPVVGFVLVPRRQDVDLHTYIRQPQERTEKPVPA